MLHAIPRPGDPAPDFDLACTLIPEGKDRARLADYRGLWLVLIFYPRDFSLLCPTELTGLASRFDDFQRHACRLLGVSCDPIEIHRRWVEDAVEDGGIGPLPFPLASDIDGAVSRAYGVLVEESGVPLRGLMVIDPEGRVQYLVVHGMSVGRSADEILRVLSALQSGGLCPHDWKAGASVLDPAEILAPGRVVAHYRIESKLGEGDNAAIFEALDLRLRRTVALKVFKPGGTVAYRGVLAEARAAAALSHPNVCTIYEVDDSEGVPFIAMELFPGHSLAAELATHGPIGPARLVPIVRQVAEGLAAAHAAGVVHGDLKPQNILLGPGDQAKLVDFGLARRIATAPGHTLPDHERDETFETLAGTPRYMAPEQTLGHPPTPGTDVFALGAILYELSTGRWAFEGNRLLRVFEQIRNVDPRALGRDLPYPLREILEQALEPDPTRRVLTPRNIADRLTEVEAAPPRLD